MGKNDKTSKYSEYIIVDGVGNKIEHRWEVQIIKTATFENLDKFLEDFVYVGRGKTPGMDRFIRKDWYKPEKA